MPDLSGSGQPGSDSSSPRDLFDDHERFSSLTQALSQSLALLGPDEPVAVACSGGADSAALAMIAAALCHAQSRPLYLFHIHHGLFAQADEWQNRVEQLAAHLAVPAGTGRGSPAAAVRHATSRRPRPQPCGSSR